jgi:hypothetical protein
VAEEVGSEVFVSHADHRLIGGTPEGTPGLHAGHLECHVECILENLFQIQGTADDRGNGIERRQLARSIGDTTLQGGIGFL